MLHRNFEEGADKFQGVWENVEGRLQLTYAEELGMGVMDYELIRI